MALFVHFSSCSAFWLLFLTTTLIKDFFSPYLHLRNLNFWSTEPIPLGSHSKWGKGVPRCGSSVPITCSFTVSQPHYITGDSLVHYNVNTLNLNSGSTSETQTCQDPVHLLHVETVPPTRVKAPGGRTLGLCPWSEHQAGTKSKLRILPLGGEIAPVRHKWGSGSLRGPPAGKVIYKCHIRQRTVATTSYI